MSMVIVLTCGITDDSTFKIIRKYCRSKLVADLIGEKSGAYDRARKPNKFKEWKLKQPLWKQFFIEVLMFTLIALAFDQY